MISKATEKTEPGKMHHLHPSSIKGHQKRDWCCVCKISLSETQLKWVQIICFLLTPMELHAQSPSQQLRRESWRLDENCPNWIQKWLLKGYKGKSYVQQVHLPFFHQNVTTYFIIHPVLRVCSAGFLKRRHFLSTCWWEVTWINRMLSKWEK